MGCQGRLKMHRPGQLAGQLDHALVALGEDLEHVVVGGGHHLEYLADEVAQHQLVKEIAHRVHEHRSGPAPAKRLIEALGMEDDVLGGVRRQPRAF